MAVVGARRRERALGHAHLNADAPRQAIEDVTRGSAGGIAGERAHQNLERLGAEQKVFGIFKQRAGRVLNRTAAQAIEHAT